MSNSAPLPTLWLVVILSVSPYRGELWFTPTEREAIWPPTFTFRKPMLGGAGGTCGVCALADPAASVSAAVIRILVVVVIELCSARAGAARHSTMRRRERPAATRDGSTET